MTWGEWGLFGSAPVQVNRGWHRPVKRAAQERSLPRLLPPKPSHACALRWSLHSCRSLLPPHSHPSPQYPIHTHGTHAPAPSPLPPCPVPHSLEPRVVGGQQHVGGRGAVPGGHVQLRDGGADPLVHLALRSGHSRRSSALSGWAQRRVCGQGAVSRRGARHLLVCCRCVLLVQIQYGPVPLARQLSSSNNPPWRATPGASPRPPPHLLSPPLNPTAHSDF